MTRNLFPLFLLAYAAAPAFAQENPFIKPGPAPKIEPKATGTTVVEKDPSVTLFKPTYKLPIFQISVDDDTLKVLNKDPKKYVRCTVRVDGKSYKDVAIHLKGAVGSFRQWSDKPALTLNLDKFVRDQSYMGLDKFHLNNSVQDGSYMNELTSSLLAEALGLPTARTTHAIVELNGRKVGLYVLKEGYNGNFIRRNFPNGTEGNLYDGGFCQDIDANLKLDHGEDVKWEDLKPIRTACNTRGDANARYEAVSRLVDVDMFVRDAALQILICDWDGYMRNRNNYRVYIPTGAQAVFIPHGMDQEFQNPNEGLWPGWGGMVSRAILDSPEGKKKTIAVLKELQEKLFTADFVKQLSEYSARTRDGLLPYNKDWSKQFENEAKQQAERVKQRITYLTKELPKLK
jgi:spore coat protein CotH